MPGRRCDDPHMSFRITGLDPSPFEHLYGLSDEALAAHGVVRSVVDATPGYPDRVELRDLEPGERVFLLNFEHQPAPTPYRASHAIFVREGARERYDRHGEIPDVMRRRLLSLRAFDRGGMIVDADVVEGIEAEPVIRRLLERRDVAYVQAHFAKRGCYAARIERA